MTSFRNDRTGETINVDATREALLARFGETAKQDNWLWFWLARHFERHAPAAPETRDMISFLADSFVLAAGMGLECPRIRVFFEGKRYKIYLSRKGTLCFKSGFVEAGTMKPVGDEEYVGCLWGGKFIASRDRTMLPTEGAFMAQLAADPVSFLAKCSRDMDRCCYCWSSLEDKRSKDVGYGPVCAVRWGLPWGVSYNEKVPSFAELWANSHVNDKRNIRMLCEDIRREPRDELTWMALGDALADAGYRNRPSMPKKAIMLPAV